MHEHHNGLKTAALFGGMFAVLLAIGAVIASSTGRPGFLYGFAIIGVVMTFYSYWNSDKIAIRSMNAYPVTPDQAPEIYRIVHELSERAQQPMPRIFVAPTPTPNAFATGRNPKNAAVCCTEGILQLLDERELRGVLGHELMHVYNRDILTSSVAAAIGGVISSVAQGMLWFGGGSRENRGNPLAMIAVALLAPIAATVIQMSISRTREYDADEDGARLTQDPLALASALNKLQTGISRYPMDAENPRVQNTAHMMIANPFRGAKLGNMFSTHPPMEQRIARLEAMAGGQGRTEVGFYR
ncbi:zinc metalloprotease HtpX [Falsarthrobacter nasiphocae]|uniref:Protease HtpX homolog n=1 Tax=Falsarthrobacter nasiphocae TaxID=189863 RepID=A0AAE4C5L9_9MICC|nr:zinc metalloprotease HtpX [Falsarthrobacter nasiphocae]MDR6892461.1 heat shock protein HtpX [Falsarthrobacter nasiphocae]